MKKDEKMKYQKYAVSAMRNRKKVKYHDAEYYVSFLLYSVGKDGDEVYTVQLDDVKRKLCSIHIGIKELYDENNPKGEQNDG